MIEKINPVSRMSRTNFDLGLISPPPKITKIENDHEIFIYHDREDPGLCQPKRVTTLNTSNMEIKLTPTQKWNWWNDPRSFKVTITLDSIVMLTIDREKFIEYFIVLE